MQDTLVHVEGEKEDFHDFERFLKENKIGYSNLQIPTEELKKHISEGQKQGFYKKLLSDNRGFIGITEIATFTLAVSPTVIKLFCDWRAERKSGVLIYIETEDGNILSLETNKVKGVIIINRKRVKRVKKS